MTRDEEFESLRRRGKKYAPMLKLLTSQRDGEALGVRQELEELRAKLNTASREVAQLKGAAKSRRIAELKPVSDRVAVLRKEIGRINPVRVPNLPRADVPIGDDDRQNVVLREVGCEQKLKSATDYLKIAESRGWIDIRRAGKVSGSRFGYLLGPVAELEFALVQYAYSILRPHGFTLVVPPVLVSEKSMAGMGYLEGGGEDETYHFPKDKLYLVGTSEQSIGPMHQDETFAEEELPRRYVSFSTCFRREAGSYGRDTRGIMRVHQFDKLEMFSITVPDKSDDEHEFMLAVEERLVQGLGLPYRVKKLCTGDLGWPSARTYDIEIWMPGQGEFRETHSVSNTTDYQSRLLNIRFQGPRRRDYVHMLNGTAFAIGRMIIAILENYQVADGEVEIPRVLREWMGGRSHLGRD